MRVNAKASVQVVPKGSQIAVFLLLIAAIAFFALACWLYVQEKKFALPLAGAVIFLLLACVFWFFSHRNESLAQSHPLKVSLGGGEKKLMISADSRSVPALNYLESLICHYHMTFFRSPLPMASGKLDAAGKVISGSELAAVSASETLNNNAQELNKEAFDSALAMIRDNVSQHESPVVSEVDVERPKSETGLASRDLPEG